MLKQISLKIVSVLFLLMSAFTVFAQTTVKGKLVDAENDEPIIGAIVKIEGVGQGVITNTDGDFTLQNPKEKKMITCTYLGYKTLVVQITNDGNMGVIKISPEEVILEGVTVSATIGLERKTPVALSNVSAEDIERKLGTQEFPEILKSTPGVHVNKQGGGYGDSELYMRGFDNTNIATMVNGVPMNDMEHGGVYWSNWTGLTDVTRIMQTQRGLGASKVSAPSVGGTTNIITKSYEAEQGGNLAYSIGNDGMNKIAFTLSSGMSKKGWAFTALGARHWGDGYVMGTDFLSYSYFANISKRINDAHSLSFTVFGSPQEHGQRNFSSNSGPLKISEWERIERQYGVKNYRYNPTFGYDNKGRALNFMRNEYHKPQISLNHAWQINQKSSLSTVLYSSIGRGSGANGQANNINSPYSFSTWNGVFQGEVSNTFRNADGTYDYGAIYDINEASEYGSALAMSKSINNHIWYGLISTYTTQIGKNINLYGGLDFRYYKGIHTNELTDLYGGKYFIDSADRSKVDPANNYKASDPNWVNQKLGVGDVVYRDYDGYVVQEGGFAQAEYSKDKLSAFVSGSLSNTNYWRYDRFYYDAKHAKSDIVGFIGGTAKGGANYNFNDNHNAFANLGFISRAPKFSYGAFMQATNSNVLNKEAKNEKIFSFELGYGFHNSWLNVKLNGYFTSWMDKTMTKNVTMTNQKLGYINMTGVNALHKGIELEATITPFYWLDLTGMLSVGDWKWDSNATGYVYDELGNAMTETGATTSAGAADHAKSNINLKGIKVGGSAQTTAAAGATFKIGKDILLGVDYTYYGRNYSYYSVSGNNLIVGKTTTVAKPWKIPGAGELDLNASYKFKVGGLDAVVSGTVNNLLNYQYVSKAYSPDNGTPDWNNVYVFYQFGRTWSMRLKLNF